MAAVGLTEDILYLIFSKYHFFRNRESLTPYTTILSVSSSWRRAAMLAICKCLWLSYSEDESTRMTNIGLIAALNGLHLVKKLSVEASIRGYGVDLTPAIELLRSYCAVWPEIQTLSIDFNFKIGEFLPYSVYNNLLKYRGDNAKRLFEILPNVTKLHFYENIGQIVELFSKIAKRYAKNATSLECSHPTIAAGQHHFKQLKHLQLDFSREKSFPLGLEVANLTSLVLNNLPRRFSWKSLVKNSKDEAVLPSLKLLEINGSVGRWTAQHGCALNFQLHFPELQKLKLTLHDGEYFLLTNGVFYQPLQCLALHGTCKTLCELARTRMPQTDNLFLAITLTDEDLIHAMDIASILAKCALHVLVKFEICSTSLVEFPNVSFHALTHLYIPGKIEMQQVVNALRCLPNLIEFEFKVRVKWQSFVKQGLDESVTLSSPLRSLAMHCSEYLVDCMDTAIKFIKYLLLRLPRLEVVVSNGIPRNEIMEFVELNQAAYSHLTSIKFSLAD